MARVTSVEFQRGFGSWRELAQCEPVVITSQGRDSLVLLSAVSPPQAPGPRAALSVGNR